MRFLVMVVCSPPRVSFFPWNPRGLLCQHILCCTGIFVATGVDLRVVSLRLGKALGAEQGGTGAGVRLFVFFRMFGLEFMLLRVLLRGSSCLIL